LNSEVFKTREAAGQELQELGNDAKPYLHEALKGNLTLEPRLRIKRLLKELRDVDVSDLEIPMSLPVSYLNNLVVDDLKNLKPGEDQRVEKGRAILKDIKEFISARSGSK
jgi:hypothetical protein